MNKLKFLVVSAVLVSGCAYYNGLYNANLLVREARKAEREGRVGEARSMWNQVVVKTDTVLARYPDSDYRDDARYLRGLALSETGNCQQAFDPLRLVVDSSPDHELVSDGRLTMGRCMLREEEYDSVLFYLQPLTEGESDRRDDALWMAGAAHRRLGNHELAKELLQLSGSDSAGFDLALVYLAQDNPAAAKAALAAVPARRYPEGKWSSALDALGAQDPNAANELAERLVERRGLTRGQKARLLISAGNRIERSNPRGAGELYGRAVVMAGDSVEGNIAGARRLLLEVRGAAELSELPGFVAGFEEVSVEGGIAAGLVRPALNALKAYLGDTILGRHADLRSFIIAEMVRDSARANKLAGMMFGLIATDHAESVLAPKAVIAAHAAGQRVDDLVAYLNTHYPTSPYTLALQGIDSPRFRAMEDSISAIRFLVSSEDGTDNGLRSEIDEEGVDRGEGPGADRRNRRLQAEGEEEEGIN